MNAFDRLTELNPVPETEQGALRARLEWIRPQLPRLDHAVRRRRWRPSIIVVVAILVLVLGGAAVAGSWNPLSAIGSADRPAEPKDELGPDVIEMLRRAQVVVPPGGFSAIGTRLVEEARLLGKLPNGDKVYALPTSKGKLCIVVALRTESCSDPLTPEHPITFTISKVGPSSPHVVWGATADDVVSVSFTIAGEHVTVPVEGNLYAWEGAPTKRFSHGSALSVTFSDGSTRPAG